MNTHTTQLIARQRVVQKQTPFWFWPAQWFTLGMLFREWAAYASDFM